MSKINPAPEDSPVNMTPEQAQELLRLANECTELQRGVVFGIANGLDRKTAYKDAGGKAKDDRSAEASVCTMLTNDNVKALNDYLTSIAASNAVMSKQEALELLSMRARVKITDIVEFSVATVIVGDPSETVAETKEQTVWRIKDGKELSDDASACIKELKTTRDGHTLSIHDSQDAIKQLAQMLGWNAPSKVEHGGGLVVNTLSALMDELSADEQG